MPATVLIVANDAQAAARLASGFNKKEFKLITVHSGRQAVAQSRAQLPDVVILDTAADHLGVKRLIRTLRANRHAILILLAQNPARFESPGGTSLVISRAISPKRLAQRVRTALDNRPPREIRLYGISLNIEKRRVTRGNRNHQLTPKEFELLRFMMLRANQVVPRSVLMQEIWHTDYLGDTRTLDVHIRWLREKIEDDPDNPRLLVTLRGQGYRLEAKEK